MLTQSPRRGELSSGRNLFFRRALTLYAVGPRPGVFCAAGSGLGNKKGLTMRNDGKNDGRARLRRRDGGQHGKPDLAQGVYFSRPGVEFGIGRPYYGDRNYRSYDGPYVYSGRSYNYDGPYAYSGRSYNSYSNRHERRQLRQDWRWD